MNGVPPHAIEVLVDDGSPPAAPNQAVFDSIFTAKAGGIQTFGTISGTVFDSRGDPRPTSFSRPTLVTLLVLALLAWIGIRIAARLSEREDIYFDPALSLRRLLKPERRRS